VPLFHLCVNSLYNYFEVLLNMLEFYFEVLLNMLEFYFEVLLNMLEFYFKVLLNMLEFASDACCYFFNIRLVMASKHSELVKRQTRNYYRRFASPPSHTAPLHSSDDSIVEMWEVPPPPTRLEEASSDDSSASSGYNDECPHIKEVSSYELLLYFNCLV
jgi:hypothetical protein